MAVAYTHNLKLILVDDKDNIIVDENIELIKSCFLQENTHKILWNNTIEKYTIKWDMIQLDKLNTQFMGDLFSCPIYNFDSIIVNHTKQIISSINNKSNYNIKFYISKLIGDKTICIDSFGVI